jgi:ATP-binding cassette subfamily B protein
LEFRLADAQETVMTQRPEAWRAPSAIDSDTAATQSEALSAGQAAWTPRMTNRQVFARFWDFTRGERRWMFLATLLLIVAAAGDTVAILLFGYVVDHVLTTGAGLGAFWRPAAAWAAATTASTAASWCGSMLSTWAGERFVLRLRTRLHAQVSAASADFLHSTRLGDVLTRFTEDLDEVEVLVVSTVIGTATAIASMVMFGVAAVLLSPTLAVLALILAPVLLLLAHQFGGRVGEVTSAERINHSRMMTVLEESLANSALTRSSGRGADETGRLTAQGQDWLKLNMRQARLSGTWSALTGLLEMLAVIGVLGVGAWQISHHTASVGVLLSFSAYLGYLYPPMHSLAGLPLTAATAQVSAARINQLLTDAVPVADNGVLVPAGPGRLTFEGVSFSYPDRGQPALAHFHLTVQPGQMLAITGPSGSGKSTLAKLLARDHDPAQGTIRLDGVDLRDYRLDALRESMTVLAQETLLFDATLADNIGYVRAGAGREQIEAAAREAGLGDLLAILPDGLDSRVGQRGRLLSGGQRQRVAIARAFLRDAPLLILDEPTTGLDHDAATELLPALRRLAYGRTTVMITHDLRLGFLADRTVTLNPPARSWDTDALPVTLAPTVPGQPPSTGAHRTGPAAVLRRAAACAVGLGALVLIAPEPGRTAAVPTTTVSPDPSATVLPAGSDRSATPLPADPAPVATPVPNASSATGTTTPVLPIVLPAAPTGALAARSTAGTVGSTTRSRTTAASKSKTRAAG